MIDLHCSFVSFLFRFFLLFCCWETAHLFPADSATRTKKKATLALCHRNLKRKNLIIFQCYTTAFSCEVFCAFILFYVFFDGILMFFQKILCNSVRFLMFSFGLDFLNFSCSLSHPNAGLDSPRHHLSFIHQASKILHCHAGFDFPHSFLRRLRL